MEPMAIGALMNLNFEAVQPEPRPVREWVATDCGVTVRVVDCGSMWSCDVRKPRTAGLGDHVTCYRDTRDEAVDAALWMARRCGMVSE